MEEISGYAKINKLKYKNKSSRFQELPFLYVRKPALFLTFCLLDILKILKVRLCVLNMWVG